MANFREPLRDQTIYTDCSAKTCKSRKPEVFKKLLSAFNGPFKIARASLSRRNIAWFFQARNLSIRSLLICIEECNG
jgi:hypothetical protein